MAKPQHRTPEYRAARGVHYADRWWPDPRGTRAFQKLARQVRAEEPLCWLRLAGCTRLSATADHVIPFVERPDLSMERANLRGACKHCNSSRQAKPIVKVEQAAALGWFD